MEANTPQLWDKVWSQNPSAAEEIYTLAEAENSIRWQRLEKIVLQEFGSFNKLRVIEIGAGAGTHAALMAKRDAQVTVMDYSEAALKRAKRFFENNGVSADFVQEDALSLPLKMHDKFDVSMSFGLTEHFIGADRVAINKAHLDVLRKGGMTFISVPNRHNLPYRIYMPAARLAKTWQVGEEYPYSRQELEDICRQLGVTEYSFFGDSLVGSLRFINPFHQIQKLRNLFRLQDDLDVSGIKREKGTPLDAHFSYALVLCAKK